MVENAFQQVDEHATLKDIATEIVEKAFEIANGLQEEANVGDGNNSAYELPINIEEEHEPLGEVAFEDGPQDNSFDPIFSEDAIKELYRDSKCTKLLATILFKNICTICGVSNKITNDFFNL
jgi:hypothetical protein